MKTEGDISSQVQNQEKEFAEKKISTKKENQNLLDLWVNIWISTSVFLFIQIRQIAKFGLFEAIFRFHEIGDQARELLGVGSYLFEKFFITKVHLLLLSN